MESIKIPNSNNQKIAAVIHRPATKSEKLAILCPGYLDTKDYTHLVMLGEDLANKGYTAVRFDPTGTWESEGEMSEYLTSQYLKDVESVLDHMLNESPYTHVLLAGHSRGGQVSILYAARDPRISAVLGIMPSHAPVTGARREKLEAEGVSNSSRDIPGEDTKRREFSIPFTHVLDRDQYDAMADIQRITVPVVLVATEFDKAVPPEGVKELYESANEPKEFIFIKGMDHEYRHNPDEIRKVNDLALEALDKFFKT
ncbi:lysophospholipase [Patescibacteria group bacterium]|nr:lysophospholipase [Patescibacteria group bacterium]